MNATLSRPVIVLALFAMICLRANAQADLHMAQKFLNSQAAEMGLQASDYECLILKNQYNSKNSGVSNHYFAQCHEGIEVYNAIFNIHFTPDGKLLTWGSRLVPGLKAKIAGTSPGTTQEEAVRAAAQQLGYDHLAPLVVKETPGGAQQEVVFEKNNMSVEDIPVRLMYQPMPDGTVRLAWNLNLYEDSGAHWWDIRVDAATGTILDKNDWVVTCDFGHDHQGAGCDGHHFTKTKENARMSMAGAAMAGVYNVYPEPVESPSHGARQLISDPDDPLASPFGWHDTNGAAGAEFTITRGNNVYAQLDDDGSNGTFGFAPDGGSGLVFDFPINLTQPPSSYTSAAITNLFYWNNLMHDLSHKYGFDEPSGNFQENNYGHGGAAGDDVIADAQDASGTNNANFSTPPDGSSPRMQMFIWTSPNPDRDSDLDNGVIAHEYGHGISIRQTGGPANSGCLSNSEQMGEGWSDYWALMTTIEPGDMGTDGRGIGTYLLGQPPTGNGIRPTPYSTNMAINPTTYGDIGGLAIPHGVGYAWCTMIWEMTWGIIAEEGMSVGYDVAMNIVNEGLKLQPCSPGFVDGRNAILAADQALYGGAHTCTIWSAFAKRGLGFSAIQGSSASTSDGVEAFDMPSTCTLNALPSSLSICQPANAQYMVIVGTGNGNVLLSTTAGVPVGAVVSFSVNPVPPGDTSIMTISNTAAIVPGTFAITIQGAGTSFTNTVNVGLTVHGNVPGAPTLLTPADGATGVTLLPALRWAAMPSVDTFTVQVATDPAFSNIVETGQVRDTAYTLTTQLLALTTYYWRAKAKNTCGDGAFSTVFSFTTGDIACDSWASTNVPVTIPITVATVISTLNIPQSGSILDVNVTNLNVSHSWIDDLIISLTSPGGTTVTLMNRPCGSEDNILINLDDEAAGQNFPCPPTNNGTYQPFSPLSAFDGENLKGVWTLTVQDVANTDGGSLNAWELDICYVPTPEPIISYAPLGDACTAGDVTLAATITDPSGVPTSGAGLPVLYWAVNSPTGPFNAATATWSGGNQYEFTFGNTATGGDEVFYYIVAQDNNSPTPSVGASPSSGAGGFTFDPPAAATPPTSPDSYSILLPATGIYTVGATGDFPTLTAAVEFYNATPCLDGEVVFELTDASYPGEIFPITIYENPGTSAANRLTIRPSAGNSATISGPSGSCIIQLNGADWVTIDGSNSGGTGRNLTIANTNSAAATAAICVQSLGAGQGAFNNTIKNCNIACGADQSAGTLETYGIISHGTTIALTNDGLDNDNNVFQNNFITKARRGIWIRGGAANPNDNNIVLNNLIGPAMFGSDEIGKTGIGIQHQNNATVTGNEVRFVGGTFAATTAGTDRCGIAIGAADGPAPTTTIVANSTVARNLIHDIVEERTSSAFGILMGGTGSPSNNTVANNMIYNVRANGTGSDQAIGIAIGAGNGDVVAYNSISMKGDLDPAPATSATQSASCVRIVSNAPANLTFKNNILFADINSNTGTLRHYAVVVPSATYSWGTGGADNNVYYKNPSGTQMVLGGIGTTVPFASATTLNEWQNVFNPTQDAHSISQDPAFIGSADLHIDPAGTPVESGGTPIPGLTTDFDGNTRNATTPDIGADEGVFTLIDLTGPGIVYDIVQNVICTSDYHLEASIADVSAVNVSAGTKPRLWFKKSTDANTLPASNNSSGNGWKYVEASNAASPFSFNMDYSLLTSPVAPGNVIQYFVVAQDLVATPNIGTNTAAYAAAPASVALGLGAFPVSGTRSFTVINLPTSVVSQASPNQLCFSGDVTLSLSGDPSTGAEYQWESSPVGANAWSPIAGATTASYVVPGADESADYRCVITCGGVPIAASPSAPATVTVSSPVVTGTAPGTECGPGPVSVALGATANSGTELNWYNSPTGGTSIWTGSTFDTPPISNTTTYYVAASDGGDLGNVGPLDPSIGAFSSSSVAIGTQRMFFDVLDDVTILSVDIFPTAGVGSSGSIRFRDNTQTVIADVPYVTTVTGGAKQTVPINITLPPGTGYEVGQGTAIALNRNTTGAMYPYTSAAINLTGNSFSTAYYYFYYNWQWSTDCETPRVPVVATILPETAWYADSDGDGFGNNALDSMDCLQPVGYVADNTDCDDANNAINPDATEVCDGLDNNCNTLSDDNDPGITGQPTWFADTDTDAYGDPTTSVLACNQPANHVADNTDCNDANAAINPAAAEICNNLDDDCSGNPEASSNTWTGDGDSTTWTDPDNWDDGIVPLECQHLAIPTGANVTIPNGIEAKGLTLEVATGALLTVPATAVLTIINP